MEPWLERVQFEYGVILKGSQTKRAEKRRKVLFEYGVILKGSQTALGVTWHII